MPSDSKRQVIMDAMKTRFLAINGGSDYHNDLSAAQVFIWRQAEIGPDQMPCIVIRDSNEPIEPLSMGGPGNSKVRATLNVEVMAAVVNAANGVTPEATAELARQLVQDLIKAIGVDQTWGVDNVWTVIKETDIDVQTGNRHCAFGYLRLEIQYPFNRFDYSA
jgi:hypothetical protein